ncbi:MAG TPA: hypothetical protein VGK59_18780 [Ohtaekwangia sp.]
MKKKYLAYTLFLVLIGAACDQEMIELQDPCDVDPASCEPVVPTCPDGASAGSINLTKFVAMGNSYVAGFQAAALFNDGQASSLAEMLATQFECVGGSTTFNQPSINSVNGYNPLSSVPGVITLGRNILFDPDGSGPRTAAPYPAGFPGSAVTCPSAVTTPPLPAPYNTADLPAAFTGDKAALNNFGVPLIYLGQALTPATGNPASGSIFNPWWARFATEPGVKSILQDALTAGGSFYLIWYGFDDVLLYAATGADGYSAGTYPMTSQAAFDGQYDALIGNMLAANPVFKGVVGNIPNFTSLPYFFTVKWNQLQLSETQVTSLAPLKTGYNGALQQLRTNGIITEQELNKRLIDFKVYNSADASTATGILLVDSTLTDLSPYFPAELDHMAKARQAVSTDLVPLAAGSVLGTCNGSAQAIFGVSYPVADRYILTIEETTAILTRTAEFNATINDAVSNSNNRLALANVNTAYANLVTAQLMAVDGVFISPSFAPPTGIYSEDGLHPNNRGYAFTANVFIDAINAKFGASIPKVNLATKSITKLPVNPATP